MFLTSHWPLSWSLVQIGLRKLKLPRFTLHSPEEVLRNPTAVRHRCAQRCDSKNEHIAVAAKTSTALWQRKRAQRCDSSVSDSADVTMYTLV